jgi:N-acetyl-anhydromuramoyl-L-alanine amidase
MEAAMQSAFNVHTPTGLLGGARQVLSPHADERPAGVMPELIVVHGISLPPGEYGGPWIEQLFTAGLAPDAHPFFAQVADLRVSAHALVRRDGKVVQFVPFYQRAWHAGPSSWQGRDNCNDYSIGIELEGTDDSPYEPAQYTVLAALIHALRDAYPTLSPERVVGHSDVAPGRKSDPGASFDWPRLQSLLDRP